MGILYSNAEFLLNAKKNGVCFDNILTIGHLKSFLTKKHLVQLAKEFTLEFDISLLSEETYSNTFFEVFLGAKNIQSLDYSDYENCNILHDMNVNVNVKYHGRFDVVIDGGSLEHIFNFPVAIGNCMNMLKKEGNLFIFTMANNHMGHGFYQFSPELFFRVLHRDNGFTIKNIFLEEHKFPSPELNQNTNIYSINDPLVVRERVGLVSSRPVLIMVHANRKEIKPIFSTYPIQSDYSLAYEKNIGKTHQSSHSSMQMTIKKIFHKLPLTIKHYLEGQRQLFKYSFKNATFYKKINHK